MSVATAPPCVKLSPGQIDKIFDGPIQRVRKSPLYVLGLVFIATAMALLPLIYVALVGALGYGLFYHVTEHFNILTGVRGLWGRLLLYVGPLVIGVILLLFMIKPLFARPPRREKRLSLVPENEPVLFAFVEKLCEMVGSPVPRRIDVICEVNASAGFRRGAWSMLGNDLVLVIGAPLVAGMTLRQFSGVLAHEFGHFTQRLGMRLGYIIRRVNLWFARQVYERDRWDLALIGWSRDSDSSLSLVFLVARFFVWLTRKLLWVLMMLGHLISCGMSRQMEYDADLHATRLAGSRNLAETHRRSEMLHLASEAVHADLAESWRNGRLGDNLPALLVAKMAVVPEPVFRKWQEVQAQSRGILDKLFSTHPTGKQRVRRAEKANADGLFNADLPASALFRNFDGLCREASFAYYQELLGPQLQRKNLISSESLLRQQKRLAEREEAAERYFHGCLTPARPLHLDRYSRVANLSPKDCVARLKQARAALEKSYPIVRKTFERFEKAHEKAVLARTAQELFKIGAHGVDAKEYQLPEATYNGATKSLSQAEQRQRSLTPNLAKVEEVVRLRLECALALLRVDRVAQRIENAEHLARRCDTVLDTLTQIDGVFDVITALHRENLPLFAMEFVLSEDSDPDENLINQAVSLTDGQQQRLADLRITLKEHPYPFDHADGKVSLGRYAIGQMPERRDISGTRATVEWTVSNISSLYIRCMGELAQIAERVEEVLGLPPIKTPEEPSKPPEQDAPASGDN